MVSYCKKVKELLESFRQYTIQQIPWSKNSHADALARLTSMKDAKLLNVIPIEYLAQLSISSQEMFIAKSKSPSWMDPIIEFLQQGKLPEDQNRAHTLWRKAGCYIILDGKLYRKGFTSLLFHCVDRDRATYVLAEIYEGICENHSGGRSQAQRCFNKVITSQPCKRTLSITFENAINANILPQCHVSCQKSSHL